MECGFVANGENNQYMQNKGNEEKRIGKLVSDNIHVNSSKDLRT